MLLQAGWTALLWAAENGRMDCARLLLDAGADKHATSNVCVKLLVVCPVGLYAFDVCSLF